MIVRMLLEGFGAIITLIIIETVTNQMQHTVTPTSICQVRI